MIDNPSVKVKCCAGLSHGGNTFALVEVKRKIDFHIEDIPFRSDQKITHIVCGTCKLPTDTIFENPAFTKATLTAAAYLKEQDTRYKYDEGVNQNINTAGFDVNETGWRNNYLPPTTDKQWLRGQITYDYYDEYGHQFGRVPFLVFATEETAVEYGIKQFVRPDLFKGIVNVKVWGPDHTRDSTRVS